MTNIKFSVLIPVYNVEKYLNQCIDSVLAQNYNNFEIILVDDGSTDNSGAICDEYARDDERIKVIHKSNDGLLYARRTAIKEAVGDYFLFLDSDDYWENGLLCTAANLIKEYNCDIIIFGYRNVFPDNIVCNAPIFHNKSIFEGKNKKLIYEKALETELLNPLCFKIVSKNIVDVENDYAAFHDVRLGEDLLQSATLYVNATRIIYIDAPFYNYRRTCGMTNSISAKDIVSKTKVREEVTKIYLSTGEDLSHSVGVELYNYINELPKYILYGCIDDPNELEKSMEHVINTDFYKNTKKISLKGHSLFTKIVIWLVERKCYRIIRVLGYALKQRNKIKGLRKK